MSGIGKRTRCDAGYRIIQGCEGDSVDVDVDVDVVRVTDGWIGLCICRLVGNK